MAKLTSMANCDVGMITSCICFLGSNATLMLGLLYIVIRLEEMHLEFSDCWLVEADWLQADCNLSWRGLFTLRPEVFLDVWTPILIGTMGSSIHVSSMRFNFLFEWLLPINYVQYALFMLVSALFAAVGYCGQLGVVVGVFCIVSAFMCILARLMGDIGIKPVPSVFKCVSSAWCIISASMCILSRLVQRK